MSEIRILYLGRRRGVADELRGLLQRPLPIQRAIRENVESGPTCPNVLPVLSDTDLTAIDSSTVALITVSNQKKVLPIIRQQRPALLLVEVGSGSASRAQLCHTVRERLPDLPIIAVGHIAQAEGAAFDGVISLPLTARPLLATIVNQLERCADQLLTCGEIQLNVTTRLLTTPNGAYPMPPKQYALLQLFMEREGQVITRGEIMQAIWNTSYLEDTRTLDVHIRWLRERIEREPSAPIHLRTVRGVGYQFCQR